MKSWRVIGRFTSWYLAGLIITGIMDFLVFGSIAPDEMTLNASWLFSWILATGFTLAPRYISRTDISEDERKGLPVRMAIWAFVFPAVMQIALSIILLVAGLSSLNPWAHFNWAGDLPSYLLDLSLSQVFFAIVVYMLARRALESHLARSAT
jgi:hypothetical protein